MDVVLSCEQVRRRQPHERQARAVRAPANLPEVRRESRAHHGGLRVLGDLRIPIEHFLHVAVRFAAIDLDRRSRIRPHHFIGKIVEHARFVVETLRREIA